MDERLIETRKGNQDHDAFLYCAGALEKETEVSKKHLTHLYLSDGFVNGINSATSRRARLKEPYEDGYYRVFRKDRANVVLYMADEDSRESYPDTSGLFRPDLDPIAQIVVTDLYWMAHAKIVWALEAKETFDASFLKGAEGVYDLHMKGRTIILLNEDFALAVAPIAKQERLPGME